MTAAGASRSVIYPMMLQIIFFGLAAGGYSHYSPTDGLLWQCGWTGETLGGWDQLSRGQTAAYLLFPQSQNLVCLKSLVCGKVEGKMCRMVVGSLVNKL